MWPCWWKGWLHSYTRCPSKIGHPESVANWIKPTERKNSVQKLWTQMGNAMWCMCLPRAHIWSLWCKTPRCQQLLWLLWFKVESRGKNSADLATRCHPQASAQKVVACWDPDWSEKHGVKWWKAEGCGTLLFFILLVEFWILSPGYHLKRHQITISWCVGEIRLYITI